MNLRFIEREGKRILQEKAGVAIGAEIRWIDVPLVEEKRKPEKMDVWYLRNINEYVLYVGGDVNEEYPLVSLSGKGAWMFQVIETHNGVYKGKFNEVFTHLPSREEFEEKFTKAWMKDISVGEISDMLYDWLKGGGL